MGNNTASTDTAMSDGELLREIYSAIKVIETKLDADYRALYGNGKPGLIADMEDAKRDIAILKAKQSWFGSAMAGWISFIAWLASTGIAFAALVLK